MVAFVHVNRFVVEPIYTVIQIEHVWRHGRFEVEDRDVEDSQGLG